MEGRNEKEFGRIILCGSTCIYKGVAGLVIAIISKSGCNTSVEFSFNEHLTADVDGIVLDISIGYCTYDLVLVENFSHFMLNCCE